jgi:hypothetical protein
MHVKSTFTLSQTNIDKIYETYITPLSKIYDVTKKNLIPP